MSRRADLLNSYQFHFDDPGALRKDRERYERVTPASVSEWAKNVMGSAVRIVLRVVPEPEESTETTTTDEEGTE